MTHVFNHIFAYSEFPAKWGASVVLPIPNVAVPLKFLDYWPISLLTCLDKVLMAWQMEAHIQRNELLIAFQSGFHCHHSTTAAGFKVTEDI
jgi:small basic protein